MGKERPLSFQAGFNMYAVIIREMYARHGHFTTIAASVVSTTPKPGTAP